METLKIIFLVCLLVLGIAISVVFIITIISVIFEPLTRKRKQQEAIKNLNEVVDILSKLDDKTEPKKKNNKKTTAKKEEK